MNKPLPNTAIERHPSRQLRGLLAGLCCTLTTACLADGGGFSTTNFQYLRGDNYELGDQQRSIITVEHANGWAYGDNFFFVDVTNPDRNGNQTGTGYYAEFSPRLSFGKMFGADLSSGIIRDYLITTTLELPEEPVDKTYLYGLAIDLDLPGFAFFQTNFYIRNSQAPGVDTGHQITLAWLYPFHTGSLNWVFEGFLDYAFGEDPLEDNLLTAPRLLLDLGALAGSPSKIYAGVEYQYWDNKFGIDGVTESVAQAMLKWVF